MFLWPSGPSGVGVNELRRRLIKTNPRLFQGAVPRTYQRSSSFLLDSVVEAFPTFTDTTRPPKGYEEPGRDYHFTSRETFDSMMCKNR